MKNIIKKIFEYKFTIPIILALLMLIGILIRATMLRSDFWYDEAFSAITVRADWSKMLEIIRLDKVHPPTFYILLKLWTIPFGSSINAIRSFTILWGVLLIPLSYIFFNKFFKENYIKIIGGICIAAIFTFSPFFSIYSVEARSYTFLAFLGLLLLLLFFEAIKTKNKKNWIAFVFVSITIVITHYLSILFLPGFLLGFILNYIYEKKGFNIKDFWLIFWLTFFSIIFLTITIFGKLDLMTKFGLQTSWWIPPADVNTILRSFTGILFGVARQTQGVPPYLEFNFPVSTYLISFIFLIASIIQAVNLWHTKIEERKNLILLTTITFTPFTLFMLASSFKLYIFIDRYLIIAGVFFLIWLTYIWVSTLKERFFVILSIYLLSILFLIYPQPITNFSKLSKYILNNQSTNTQLIFNDPLNFVLMKYYLPDYKKYVELSKTGSDYLGWALIERTEEKESYKDCHDNCIYIYSDSEKINDTQNLQLLDDIGAYKIYKLLNN